MMDEHLERRVQIIPGFDKRHTESGKNYGINGGSLWMTVIGQKGAVSIGFGLNWYPPTVTHVEPSTNPKFQHLTNYGLTYHHRARREDWQTQTDTCEYLDGAPCYGGTVYSAGEQHREALLTGGSDAVWALLEADYADMEPA